MEKLINQPLETDSKTPEQIRREAKAAIGDAMVIAYAFDPSEAAYNDKVDAAELRWAKQLEIEFPHDDPPYPSISEDSLEVLDNITVSKTEGLCGTNSNKTLNFLIEKHADLFERFYLLSSQHGQRISEIALLGGWLNHVVFLAKDKAGTWYAGSPANYEKGKAENRLNTFYESTDLEEVLHNISEDEGIFFEIAEQIEQAEYFEPEKDFEFNDYSKVWIHIISPDEINTDYDSPIRIDRKSV